MKKAQTAMEYLTTYGWMLLILVVVLAALAVLGILTPSRPTMCSFPATFLCKATKLTSDGNLTLDLSQITGHDITVLGVNCTKDPGDNPTMTAVNVYIRNNDHDLIANGANIRCLDSSGNIASGRTGGYYTGKVVFYYIENDTYMSHLIIGDVTLIYE
jgi:hypothetical protein